LIKKKLNKKRKGKKKRKKIRTGREGPSTEMAIEADEEGKRKLWTADPGQGERGWRKKRQSPNTRPELQLVG